MKNNYCNNYLKVYEKISKEVQSLTQKEDNVLVLGNNAIIYLMSNREYKGKYLYQIPIANQDEKIAKEETQFFDGEIDRLRRYILLAYGIKNKKIGTINEKLEQLNAPVRILNQKCNKKENRNKTYWKVVEVTEMEKR